MANSTATTKKNKPAKPYVGFLLTAHPSGRWCKKIRGKLHYFGRWGVRRNGEVTTVDNPNEAAQDAVDLFNEQRDDLYAGRSRRKKSDSISIADLCNQFLDAKREREKTGELTLKSWQEYRDICANILKVFARNRPVDDLQVDDFNRLRSELATGPRGKRGPASISKNVGVVRMLFKYAFDAALIETPIRLGPNFKAPSKRIKRQARQASGKRMFEADELRTMLDNAQQPMRAMILLAINGGLGQTDIANLPQSAIDAEGGWLDYPRPKTAVERRVPLWPETVAALREAIKSRPRAASTEDDEMTFLTRNGVRFVRNSSGEKQTWTDAVGQAFKKLLKPLDINGKRNFYALRHTFETIAGESKDQVAVNSIMGHADQSMAASYRERISDERLRAVVETVQAWLWPADDAGGQDQ
jgi:integrase